MIYTTDKGDNFVGKYKGINENVIVETSSSEMEDGYIHIIKLVGKIKEPKNIK